VGTKRPSTTIHSTAHSSAARASAVQRQSNRQVMCKRLILQPVPAAARDPSRFVPLQDQLRCRIDVSNGYAHLGRHAAHAGETAVPRGCIGVGGFGPSSPVPLLNEGVSGRTAVAIGTRSLLMADRLTKTGTQTRTVRQHSTCGSCCCATRRRSTRCAKHMKRTAVGRRSPKQDSELRRICHPSIFQVRGCCDPPSA
jgi:hypothetical protein